MTQNGFKKLTKRSRKKESLPKIIPPIFNYILDSTIITRIGEEFCDKCKGSGIDSENRISKYRTKHQKQKRYIKAFGHSALICPECNGKGKMIWTEKIMGIK